MLSKMDAEILIALCEMVGDGYEVVTIDDIVEHIKPDAEVLNELPTIIKTLDVERYISLKYAMDGDFCLKILPMGRRKVDEMHTIPMAKLSNKTIFKSGEDGSNIIAIKEEHISDAELVIEQLFNKSEDKSMLAESALATTTDNSLLPVPSVTSKRIGTKSFFIGLFGGVVGSGIAFALYYLLDIVLAIF